MIGVDPLGGSPEPVASGGDLPTLYHCIGARSFRPLWVIEELNLPHRLVILPFPPRVRAKAYLAVNDLGTVPAFFDDQVAMTESSAICEYLSARHDPRGLGVASDESEYGAYLNWLHFADSTLTFPQALVLRYGRFEPLSRRSTQVVEDYSRWFLARLRRVVAAVSDGAYLCAERFTAADICVGYALYLARHVEPLRDRLPQALDVYWHALSTRPGFQRAVAAEFHAARNQGIETTHSALTTPG